MDRTELERILANAEAAGFELEYMKRRLRALNAQLESSTAQLESSTNRVEIGFRIDHSNPNHTTVSIFANHAFCGTIIGRTSEIRTLLEILRAGAKALGHADIHIDGTLAEDV